MSEQTKPILLDGSMGQEIVNRGGKSSYGEWSVAALYENPELVKEIHRDYINVGADVITTNSYSTTRTRLKHTGMEDRFEELVNVAGRLAVGARDEAGRDNVQIAASIPPLEDSYIYEFELSFDEMVAQYAELMTLLDPYVDIYLGETLSTTLESRAFLTAAQGRGKPIWVSWTLKDHGHTHLRGHEEILKAVDSVRDFSVDALLVNCTTPDSIAAALPTLKQSPYEFGAYANAFIEISETWEKDTGVAPGLITRTDLTPDLYAEHVQQWLDAGAAIIGGCCDIGPAHIARLREMLDSTD